MKIRSYVGSSEVSGDRGAVCSQLVCAQAEVIEAPAS